ncbi:hypothetical protein JTB14_024610 [Gonioctena quinquepunctata]|nr:hypothetical protein JTB14_024610 [Gonioctena quinquepunctata]
MRTKYMVDSSNLRDTDVIEMRAFFGLLIYTSVFNSSHENIKTLFSTDGNGIDIFRAVMSKKRFAIILSALRFDNPEDRDERIKQDPLAAISFIFNSFINNSQSVYGMGQSATVDKILVSFRGRVRFKMYMPKKPCKYSIKIMALTDARNSYLFNAYIYAGKDSDGIELDPEFKKLSKPTQAVLRLARPLFGTNRNITADNWFSSVELADLLLEKNLTHVGTVKKKREIPPSFLPNKRREVESTLYGFREQSTMISYVGKKNKATVLISTMYDRIFTDPETKKPEIIAYYNANKGGVDSLDEKCAKSTSSRRTRRWPLAIFFRILDVSVVNSYILHQCYKNNEVIKEKAEFAKELAAKLVKGNMERRLQNPRVPRELRLTISRILGRPEENVPVTQVNLTLQKRRACYLCHKTTHRMTKYLCLECVKPVCLQCSKPKCNNCSNKP